MKQKAVKSITGFLFLLFISCKDKGLTIPTSAGFSDSLSKSIIVGGISNELSEYNWAGDRVGIAGTITRQYEKFELLKKYATDNELIKLTDHQSPVVKTYAFRALCERRSPFCRQILEAHLKDTSSFMEYSGCMGGKEYTNHFFLSYLKTDLPSRYVDSCQREIMKLFEGKESYIMLY